MDGTLHALAPSHMPFFITAPGETDVLLNAMIVFVIVLFLLIGVFYFKLHSLPERLAHKNPNKMQFEIVAVLGLIALLTHNPNFWFAALILAMIRLPDYQSPLETIAGAMTGLVNRARPAPAPELVTGPAPPVPLPSAPADALRPADPER
jgi:hypothetical protein